MNENHLGTELQNPERQPCNGPTLGRGNAGSPRRAIRPVLRITSFRCRPLDKDNLYRGAKPLLDGLRYAGLISGDSEAEIDYEAVQQKVAHRCDEKTVIELELPENNY